jgi:hypothetical protein
MLLYVIEKLQKREIESKEENITIVNNSEFTEKNYCN